MRRVLCLLKGHGWVKTRYEGADTAEGYYLTCRRCGRQRHGGGTTINQGAHGMGGLGMG